MDCSTTINAQAHSLLRTSTDIHEHGYTHSLASSPTSSTSSIFSLDAASSQSSVSSTSSSWDSENEIPSLNQAIAHQHSIYTAVTAVQDIKPRIVQIDPANAVGSESRQHPRRTRPPIQPNGPSANTVPRPPPSLVRQSDRKDNFVESLVGKLRMLQVR